MTSSIIAAERLLGVHNLVNRGLGAPKIASQCFAAAASGVPNVQVAAAETNGNVFAAIVGFIVGVVLLLAYLFIANFVVGFVGAIILVILFKLEFMAFYAVFPAAFVYFVFWDRLFGFFSLLPYARQIGAGTMISYVIGALLVLPAAYYLSRYGIEVSSDIFNLNIQDPAVNATADAGQNGVTSYLQGFLEPHVLAPMTIGLLGLILGRPSGQ